MEKPKTYAVEIMGQKEPTYIVEDDVVKIYKAMGEGYSLVMVGSSMINPSSIARIRRAWDVDESVIEGPDEELKALIMGKEIKKLK